MSDVQLGVLAPAGADRDATHVAVVPMTAAHQLTPGTHVGIVGAGVAGVTADKTIGIVDPYLVKPVERGERFYLCIYPRTVTGLRHVYTHPDLDAMDTVAVNQKEVSERWLRDFCDRTNCPGYEAVIAKAIEHQIKAGWHRDEEYLHFSGDDAHGEIPPEFWEHAEIVTGKKLTRRAAYFSCAC